MEISIEEINKKIAELPEELQDLILDTKKGEELVEICRKHNANSAQMTEIALLMNYVILGFVHPNNFAEKIEELGIEKDNAYQIAEEINKKIFVSIRETLKKLYSEGGQTENKVEELTEEELQKEIEKEKEINESENREEENIMEKRFLSNQSIHPTEIKKEETPKKQKDPYREAIE